MSDASAALPNGFEILQKMWEAFTPPSAFTAPLTQLMESSAPLLSPEELEKRIAEMRAVEQWLTLNVNMLRSTIQAFEVQRATYATLRSFGASLGAAAQGMQGKAQAAPSQASEPAAPAPESAGEAGAGGAAAAGQSPFAEAASAYAALDPNLWWNAVRDQFEQIAAAAQSASAASAPSAAKPAAKAAAKGAGRKTADKSPRKPAGAA
ncbi:PhaM family polyhydroxyalkanoate granule multifunctional regulatory protein [Pandoraea sp.]|uniref:PhaM family polyhydroxyalkanoate granule multifunctional regulatory protein n=1 Tax=Pandoraea sp. TaxID=1883445 RepID=UPI0011FB7D49|nr:PhaM family polyhydroxyalkanoate granule multifunctional regulatory protein [Pandoraea sp.]TAL52509.1 MAG: alginate biosynthesis protein AlgP [Pandoraea sp.]TAM14455.1 MAG: alginate biosynthesis protein AlgP [Pandoraea sp.]